MASKRAKKKNQPAKSQKPLAFWPPFQTHLERGIFALTMGLIAIIYFITMWPTVGGGDSGELTGAACSFGMAHPPGYPIFSFLGHIFSHIPFGTPGWRVNLLSVFVSIIGSCFFYLTLIRWTQNTAAAVAATGTLAFSTLIWRYSIVAEVFALNYMFFAILLYFFSLYWQSQQQKFIFWMAFTFGLGMANHHTIMFVGAPLGFFLLWEFRKKLLQPKTLCLIIFCFALGLLPYLYLPWASTQHGLVTWGDASTFKGFLTHFLRKEYGTLKLASQGSDDFQMFYGLWYYFLNLMEHLGYIGGIALVFGFIYLKKKNTKLFWLFLLFPIFYLIFFHALANLPYVKGAKLYRDIVSRFWILGHVSFFFTSGLGIAYLLEKLKFRKEVLIGLSFLIVFVQMGINFKSEYQGNNYTFEKFGRRLLAPISNNAIFLSLGDINTNTVRYLQACEGFRSDVKTMDRSIMSYPWAKKNYKHNFPQVIVPAIAYFPGQKGGYTLKNFFDANYKNQDIFVTYIKTSGAIEAKDTSWKKNYQVHPYALSFQVKRKGDLLNIKDYVAKTEKFVVNMIEEYKDGRPALDSWDNVIYNNYWLAHHLRAVEVLRWAMKNNFNQEYLHKARTMLEFLIANRPKPLTDYYKNLGISYHHLARLSHGSEKSNYEKQMIDQWKVYLARASKKAQKTKTFKDISTIMSQYTKKTLQK